MTTRKSHLSSASSLPADSNIEDSAKSCGVKVPTRRCIFLIFGNIVCRCHNDLILETRIDIGHPGSTSYWQCIVGKMIIVNLKFHLSVPQSLMRFYLRSGTYIFPTSSDRYNRTWFCRSSICGSSLLLARPCGCILDSGPSLFFG